MNPNIEAIVLHCNLGSLKRASAVSGGSINDAFQIETTQGKFFLKLNNANRYPNMFETEKRGLDLLGQSSFVVPKALSVGILEANQFILMDWIDQGSPETGFWNEFGRILAEFHLLSSEHFGLDHDNYIGSVHQSNSEYENWAEFYREERLIPQMKLAERQSRLTPAMKRGFERLFRELENIFPKEKPSLLHGDLWSGNMVVADKGTPCIFDPAVYYGHREMDLAMMALFGGFGEVWVGAYNDVFPLETDWRERLPIGQLYPLMVHVNLFGGGYAGSVEKILNQFT